MTRADVSVRDFQRWMGTRRLQDPDHAMHCLLAECFGELAPKPFRLIVPQGGATGCLYGYGQSSAEELREAAAICSDPLQARILPADGMDSKPMPIEWQKDKCLGFEVRIRPIVRRTDKAEERPGKECDAFLHEALQHPKEDGFTRTREQVYAQWLSARFKQKGGATLDLDSAKLVSFQRTRAHRKLRARHSEGPDAVIRGVLTVTDPGPFANMLAHGIGRHRSYGFGMLLLRPTRQ
jgi:CRISPR system Cascade subunit CasE